MVTFDIKGLCTSQVFQPFLTFYIKRLLGVAVNPATFDIKGLCTSQVFQPYLAFYIKRLGVAVNPANASAFQYWCLAYTLVYYHRFYPLKEKIQLLYFVYNIHSQKQYI